MSIRHVVCMRFQPDAPEAEVASIVDALRTLPAQIPEVVDFRVGLDVGVNPTSWDLALTADFHDEAGYVAYRDHPEHQRIIREHIEPIVEQRTSVQFPL